MNGSAHPAVSARALSKHYGRGELRQRVLDAIDLEVAAGEFLVVLGRSGSGKSTLLNLVGAMDTPDAGELFVAGEPLHQMTERDRARLRRHHIGFVFQAFNLIPTLTVRENLRLPLELIGAPDPARADELIERLGLAATADRYPEALSGGEQQRVAVARAVVHRPRLIVADEPTGNLDLENGRTVVGMLDSLVRESGSALIMATHSAEVMGYADRVVTIERGRLEPGP